MYVGYKQLVEMIGVAYDAGLSGALDMKEHVVDEIANEVGKSRELRIFAVEELRNYLAGSVFHHSLFGRGEIITKKGVRQPFMKFDNGLIHAFSADTFPWDVPMMLIERR